MAARRNTTTTPKRSTKATAQKPRTKLKGEEGEEPMHRTFNVEHHRAMGTFINPEGVEVDELGVAVNFKKLREHDSLRLNQSLEGLQLQPADLLKAIAFDPRYNFHQRMSAAVAAAPYFTSKLGPAAAIDPNAPSNAVPTSVHILFKNASKKK